MPNEQPEPGPPETEPVLYPPMPVVPRPTPEEKRHEDLNQAFWGGNQSSVRTTHAVMPGNVRGGR